MSCRWVVTWVLLTLILGTSFIHSAVGSVVFRVHHKYNGYKRNLDAMKSHDSRRRSRLLVDIDLPLGGNGQPSGDGLYFTKVGIGNPAKYYYVQVDTGSDILWVNCIKCHNCPKETSLGIELTLFDPHNSYHVNCNDTFCKSLHGRDSSCAGGPCEYNISYGDGSSTAGFFVNDTLQFDQVSGNLRTTSSNGSVVFGCATRQSGELGASAAALDGILGFGQANSSVISQLALAGKIKKMFAHCLDDINGGGIFAVGDVSPKVKSIPFLQNEAHYTVSLKAIEVGNDRMDFQSDPTVSSIATIIDSGTTLAYFPRNIYNSLRHKILSNASLTFDEQFTCISSNIDYRAYPSIKLVFQKQLTLTISPEDYFFNVSDEKWCFGLQLNDRMQSSDNGDVILLGDSVLSNKLVVYDLEAQAIGWTDYNCSSSIKLKDKDSGTVYEVGAHNISAATCFSCQKTILMLSFFYFFCLLSYCTKQPY